MRIIYFGFDFYIECFKTLLDDPRSTVVQVYTFPTDNRLEFNQKLSAFARKKGIPVSLERPSAKAIDDAELIISAGYPYRIPIPKNPLSKGINIHPELLPRGRGPWPLPYVILKELPESGVTIHKLSQEFDMGDILLQKSFSVSENDTLDTLSEKSGTAAAALLRELMGNFDFYWENARQQGQGEYWPEPEDALRTIHPDMKIAEIRKISRAFGSYGIIFRTADKFLTGHITDFEEKTAPCPPGTVTEKNRGEYIISVSDGTLHFKEQL